MNINLVEVLVASLAVWEIIEIWKHSALLAAWRARAELLEGNWNLLFHCGFCMTPWVSWAVCLAVVACPTDKLVSSEAVGEGLWLGLFLLSVAATVLLAVRAFRGMRAWKKDLAGTRWEMMPIFLWLTAVAMGLFTFAHTLVGLLTATACYGIFFMTASFLKLTVLGFAVARLANLGNDLTHAWCRTPRENRPKVPYSDKAIEKEPEHDGDP